MKWIGIASGAAVLLGAAVAFGFLSKVAGYVGALEELLLEQ